MKLDLDIAFTAVIGLLLFTTCVLFTEVKSLQVQIDELKIIVNQKFLPAMIFDKENLMPR